ncbi:MAG: DUF2851 family protein [Bacteroidota bacterium]
MTEDFLHYIWKFRLFDNKTLRTSDNEKVDIIKPGEHNTDDGPDFSNARIKIGNTTWAGNVEIHINASDWEKHRHHKDNSYENIILHVVYNNNYTACRKNKEPIPVLEIRDLIPFHILSKYNSLQQSRNWIPCQPLIKQCETVVVTSWLERMLVERLERKSEYIATLLKHYRNNWEQVFYVHLARNFGFSLNAEPFELLAKSTPLKNIIKHHNNLFQTEAMLFGQSGLIRKPSREKYENELIAEYTYLQQKFNLKPIAGHLWKFLRLQPSGFPSIRIAQFASLLHKSSGLFSCILEARKISEIESLFDVEGSEYWNTHYVFGKPSPRRLKKIGKASIDIIIINTVIPFLFVYGSITKEDKYKDRALRFLEQMEREKNSVISKWKLMGMPVRTASNTQALLELKNNYCKAKLCLNCGIGNFILRKGK